MLRSRKFWRRTFLTFLVLGLTVWVVRTWVVSLVIRQQIHRFYAGYVEVDGWWLNTSSAGLKGVRLHEGVDASSPVWLTADRIDADVSLGGIFRGRFLPTRITIDDPTIALRFGRDDRLTTQIPLVASSGGAKANNPASPLPEIIVRRGSGAIRQEGHEELSLARIDGTLRTKDGREDLDVTTADPLWGRFTVKGVFDPGFQVGQVRLATERNLRVDRDKTARIPFVPAEVWTNLEPEGPVEARVRIDYRLADATPVHLHTEIDLHGVNTKLQPLEIAATGSTGEIVVDDQTIRVQDVEAKTLGGSIRARGVLEFGGKVPQADLKMNLSAIDITQAPKSWQLEKVGADGRLSGTVDLKLALPPTGPDLSGTVGEAVIEGGLFQGIPIKSLSVTMRAEGRNLEYEAFGPGGRRTGVAGRNPPRPGEPDSPESALWQSLEEAVPALSIWNGGRTVSRWIASEIRKQGATDSPAGAGGKSGGIRLPRTISTEIELEDVNLDQILAKAETFGIKVPVPVAGKFSLKANATIPIATPGEIRRYRFHGETTLKGASIDHVDIGQIEAKLDLIDGVLELSDFRGQFVDHPLGDESHPPVVTSLPEKDGVLRPGAFRGRVRVPIAPQGRLTAKVEGHDLPLGELAAPALPVPTPLSGLISLGVEASADVAHLGDPTAWKVDGHAESRQITYRGKVLDRVATRWKLDAALLTIPEFSAVLLGQPLTANGHLEVVEPYKFEGRVDVKAWEMGEVLGFIPTIPRPAPVEGTIDAQGEAGGSLIPFSILTRGSARVLRARTTEGPIGNLVFQWLTDRDVVTITGLEAQTFGGKLTAEARIPTRPGRLLETDASFQGIDLARVAAATLGNSPRLTGMTEGKIHLQMPMDLSSIDADVSVKAPDLTVDGVPAESAQIKVKGVQDKVNFEITADSLGGKVRLTGSAPVEKDRSKLNIDAELQAAGFQMLALWRSLGMSGEITRVDGLAAVMLNLRATGKPFGLWSRGMFELRDLHLESPRVPIGSLRGDILKTPTSWRVDNVTGDFFGGPATGSANGETQPGKPPVAAFDFRVDQASLGRMMLAVPALARGVTGTASARITGRLNQSLQASSDVRVARAQAFHIPLTNFHFPAEISWNPTSGSGTLNCRQWTTRVAGGSLRGNIAMRLGQDHSFQMETNATDFDIEMLSRIESDQNRAASGKVTGRLSLQGHDINLPATYRGRIDVNLADASLVEVPMFKELIRLASLGNGSGSGGLFEVGELHGMIANQTVNVSQFTLEGKILQVHATGTVTFAGALNLEVLMNTNRLIPESGQNLIRIIPGLGEAIGRGGDALVKVSSFLSNRLLKFRVTGTAKNPTVNFDAGVAVSDSAAGFFSSVLRLPLGGSR